MTYTSNRSNNTMIVETEGC